jgi:hypothetical protein
MGDVRENGIMRLSTTTGVNMAAAAKTILFTVPAGKRAIITHVIIRDPSATLAGCDDVDFGTGAASATQNFLNNETGIGDMTATTDFMVLVAVSDEYTIIDGDAAAAADREFGMTIVDGSDGAATATIDVFGYLFDS